jgi:hypothetical protein
MSKPTCFEVVKTTPEHNDTSHIDDTQQDLMYDEYVEAADEQPDALPEL